MKLTSFNFAALALAAISGAYAADKPFAFRGSAKHVAATGQKQSEELSEDALAAIESGQSEDALTAIESEQSEDALVALESEQSEDALVALESEQSEDALVALESSDCDRGMRDGQRAMRRRWSREGRNCDNAWNLDSMSSRVNRSFPTNGRNWRETTRNRCARRGVDREVRAIRKRCFEDNPSQCTGLGEAAARLIVEAEVCGMGRMSSAGRHFERSCRRLAYSICEGQITTQIQNNCPRKMPSTSQVRRLGRMCRSKVDNLTGRSGIEAAAE